MFLEGCEIIQILESINPASASSSAPGGFHAWHFLAPGFYLVLGPGSSMKGRQRTSVPRLVGPLPSRVAAEALRISALALGVAVPRSQAETQPTRAAHSAASPARIADPPLRHGVCLPDALRRSLPPLPQQPDRRHVSHRA